MPQARAASLKVCRKLWKSLLGSAMPTTSARSAAADGFRHVDVKGRDGRTRQQIAEPLIGSRMTRSIPRGASLLHDRSEPLLARNPVVTQQKKRAQSIS